VAEYLLVCPGMPTLIIVVFLAVRWANLKLIFARREISLGFHSACPFPLLFVPPSIRMACLCFVSFSGGPAEHLAAGWGHDLLSCINRNGSAIMAQL